MVKTLSYLIFKQGSKTFFIASLFFPEQIKQAVFDLYAFVRTFDDFVDQSPPQIDQYQNLKSAYYAALKTGTASNSITVTNFIAVQKKYLFDQAWIDAFFDSMEMDFSGKEYQTLQETEKYIYGSAEVIGLMMAKIMDLDSSSYKYAQLLGKAFQYMNMIRDVKEDIALSRVYLPQSELKKYNLKELSFIESQEHPNEFDEFIRAQISIYYYWRDEAKKGFKKIPRRYRIPINIALDLFDDTIKKIHNSPKKIFLQKITPSKFKVIAGIIKQVIIS